MSEPLKLVRYSVRDNTIQAAAPELHACYLANRAQVEDHNLPGVSTKYPIH